MISVFQLVTEANQPYLMDEAEDYLDEILPFIGSRCTNSEIDMLTPQRDSRVVMECIDAIVKWARIKKQQDKVFEVNSIIQHHRDTYNNGINIYV